MICPDFPRKLINAAASCAEPILASRLSGSATTVDKQPKFKHGQLRIALYFHILYEEWLKYIETIFREEGSLDCLSVFRLRAYLEDCRKNFSITFAQPPAEGLAAALATLTTPDVSFVALLRALMKCSAIQNDAISYPTRAVPLLSESAPLGKAKKNSGPKALATNVAASSITASLPAASVEESEKQLPSPRSR